MKVFLTFADGKTVSEYENPNDKQFRNIPTVPLTSERPCRLWERGRESNGNPTGGAQELHLFLVHLT